MKKIASIVLLMFICTHANAQWTVSGSEITTGNVDHMYHRLAKNANNNVMMAWIYDYYGSNPQIRLTMFDPFGRFLPGWTQNGVEISLPNGDYRGVEIFASEDDNFIVGWYGYTTTGTGSDREHVFIQKYDNTGTGLWNSGNPIQVSVDSFKHHLFPDIISDGNNGVFVAWTEYDLNLFPSSNDIYMQHIDNTGNIASGWNTNPLMVAGTPSVVESKQQLALSTDKKSVYLFYSEGSINVSIYAMRLNASDGSMSSTFNGGNRVTISPGTNIYMNAGRKPLTFTHNDKWYVTWVEFNNLGEVYLQGLDSTGTKVVNPTPLQIYTNSKDDISYFSAVVNPDSTFTFGIRVSDGVDDYIHLQRHDFTGTNINGTISIDIPKTYAYPELTVNGNNGNYVFYKNISSPNTLKVQNIDEDGNTLPNFSNGVFMDYINNPNGTNPHRDFQSLYIDSGMAISVWNRLDGSNMYQLKGCNIYYDGNNCDTIAPSLPVAINKTSNSSESLSIYPNPSNNKITITLDKSEKATLKIFDVYGKLHLIKTRLNTKNSIDISAYAKGIYLIQINYPDKSYTEKLIKN